MYTYDRFQPGSILGAITHRVDAALLDQWQQIYSEDQGEEKPDLPRSIFQALFMRAYLDVVIPRPPGNVQASQKLTIHHCPRLDDEIAITITCEGKEMRKGRPHIWIGAHGYRDAQLMFDGVLRVIWAC